MSIIRNFDDLVVWQKARHLARAVYVVSQQGQLKQDYSLARQMQRAAVSIMSNIAEGHERANPGDFHRFLAIAKGSCAELRSQLTLTHDIGYISESEHSQLQSAAVEVSKMLGALMVSVKAKRSAKP